MADPSNGYSWWGGGDGDLWARKGNAVFNQPLSANVGIGVTNPAAKLDVLGDARVTGDVRVTGQLDVAGNVGIGTDAPEHALDIVGTAKADLFLAGNIGVGTDSPAYPVEIVGAIKADEYIGLPSEGQLLNPLWRRNDSNIYFHELGGPSQSNVGIGTDAPEYKFHVGLGESTKIVQYPAGTAVLIPYPPPDLSWQPVSINDGDKCRHYEANVTSISTDIQGLYLPGEYMIGINDGVDDNNGNQNASSQTNNISHAFGLTRGDFRSGLEMDFCLNNNADVQAPRNDRPISIFFASPNAIKLKKYLIQAGESTRGQPFMWQLYGYTRQLTYFDMRAGEVLTGGVLIHEVGNTGSLNSYDESLQFGMRSQRMELKWTGFRNEWQDTDTWDSKYLSRVYTPANTTTAFKSFELRFLYIANLVFNTYIDRDGEILQDPVRNGKPKKAYHKDVNKNGDVYTYNLSIGNIRFFTEAESAQTQLVLQDQQSFQVNPDRWGFVASRNKTWQNLWYLTKPTYSLDVSIFDTAKHTNELIPSPGVSYQTNPKRYVLTANDLFTIPATAVTEQGFSFYISLTPTGTGQVATFETEWNPDRYIDGRFEYAVDIDFDPSLQYVFTWWDDIFANTGGLYLNTPAAYPFIRVFVEQDSVTAGKYNLVAVFYLYDDAQGVTRDDANAKTPIPFVARVDDIALNQIQHFVFNVTPGFFYIYELVSSDGFILRTQVETTRIKPVLFKLCTIGKPENVDGISGCPMSLYAFALFNAPLTYEQRDAIGDMIISDQLGNFNSVNANIQQDLSLPLLTYDTAAGYKLELDGSIVSAAALKIAVSERFVIGKDEIEDSQGTIARLKAATDNDRLTVRGNTRMDGLATVSSNIVPWAGANPLIGEDSRRFSGIYLNDAVHLSNVSLTQTGNALRVGFGTSAGDFAAANITAADLTATDITCDSITADTYYNLPATTWGDITGKPSIFPSDWDSVADKPSFFSGDYADLTNKPWAYSGGNILSQGGNVGIGTDASYTLNVGGNVNFSGELTKNGEPFLGIGDSIPVGAILPYYSATVSDPSYLICDGATYQRNDYIELANALGVNPAATTFTVPDLRDKFLKGKNADAVGATGGSATKTLTEANMPAHSHSGTTDGGGSHRHDLDLSDVRYGGNNSYQYLSGWTHGDIKESSYTGTKPRTVTAPNHTHTFTTDTKGSGTAFDILPPYNVVIYVIKAKNNQYITPIRDGDYWSLRQATAPNVSDELIYLSGNVGIGTTDPQALLDVNGNLRVTGQVVSAATQGTAPFVVASTTLVGNLNADLLDGQQGSYYLDYNNLTNKPTNTGNQWTTSGTNIYYSGGNVGIGTATPLDKLHVQGSVRTSGTHYVINGDNSITRYGPNSTWASYLNVGACPSQIDGTTAQCISTNGNLHLDSATGRVMYLNFYRSGNGGNTNFDSIYSYGNQTHNGELTVSGNITTGSITSSGRITTNNNQLFTNGIYMPGSGTAGDGLPQARFTENWGIRYSSPDTRWVLSTSGSLVVGTTPTGQNWGSGNVHCSGTVYTNTIAANSGSKVVVASSEFQVTGEIICVVRARSNSGTDYVGVDNATANNQYFTRTLNLMYNTFTGFHRNITDDELLNAEDPDTFKKTFVGRVVVSTGEIATDTSYKVTEGEETTYEWTIERDKEGITIEDALPVVRLSRQRKDKRVFGVLGMAERNNSRAERLIVNSVGEGAMWVVDTNGPIENGDYIQSSPELGYGERQDDDLLHNFTVAKATMPCDFTLGSPKYECVELENGVRAAFIAVTYHCG